MNKDDKNQNWPEAEHRHLDPLLAQLGHLEPGHGFADAVMGRIDFAAVAVQQTRSTYISKGLGWALFGGYSVASAAALVLLIGVLGSNTFPLATLGSEVLASVFSLWQTVAQGAAQWLPSPTEFFSLLPAILGGMVVLWLVTIVSAVGLYRIMNSYSSGRTSLNAIR